MKHLIKKLLREGLESNKYFNLKTGAPDYDNLLSKNYDYVSKKLQSYEAYIEYMTMEEYIKEVAQMQRTSYDEQFKYILKQNVNKIKDNMSAGIKYNIPYLNYADKEQEGRHRVLAAHELGLKKIPVLIIDNNSEEEDLFEKTYDLNIFDEALEFSRLFSDKLDYIPRFYDGVKMGTLELENETYKFKKPDDLPEVYWNNEVKPLNDLILTTLKKLPKDIIDEAMEDLNITSYELTDLLQLVDYLRDQVPNLNIYLQRMIYGVSKYMSDTANYDRLEVNDYSMKIDINHKGIAKVYSIEGKEEIGNYNFGFKDNEEFYDNLDSEITIKWINKYPLKN